MRFGFFQADVEIKKGVLYGVKAAFDFADAGFDVGQQFFALPAGDILAEKTLGNAGQLMGFIDNNHLGIGQ
jgi:hypothetical protein